MGTLQEQEEILSLKARKSQLAMEKREIELANSKISVLIKTSGRMPNEKYRKCVDSQYNYKRRSLLIERELVEIGQKIRALSVFTMEKKAQRDLEKSADKAARRMTILESLELLRDEYHNFSADSTRIASMRQMAAEFANKISFIMRKETQNADDQQVTKQIAG